MARTRRTVEVRIADIESKKAQYQSKIENYKTKISQLDSLIQEIKETQKQKELEKLLSVIKASGKTPEEVITALNN